MGYRKKIKEEESASQMVQYQNAYAQIVSLLGPRCLYAILGRGSAKTTDILCERLVDLVQEMPGAPLLWVADSFAALSTNVLPAILEGLERKGWREGVHFVIEKAPPTFTEREKECLPGWLRPRFWNPVNKLHTYKRTMIFYTGANLHFGSFDRPSSVAGVSCVHLLGDEGKYFKEAEVANAMKAIRGYRPQFGNSPYYRGCSFTSDMYDPSHPAESGWMVKQAQNMDKEALLLVAKVGLVYNEAQSEYAAAKVSYLSDPTAGNADLVKKAHARLRLWKARWEEVRCRDEAKVLLLRGSSYVNADILTEDWFADGIAARLGDFNTAVLSCFPSLEGGNRFYTRLADHHYYYDGVDERAAEQFALVEEPDCRVLRYLKEDAPIELGVDFGNMCSMVVAQSSRTANDRVLRVLAFFYTLPPSHLRELADKFLRYFAHHKQKVIKLYYDRSGNQNKKINQDKATELKSALEKDKDGKRTGWRVDLMSLGQGNIGQTEEYYFQLHLLGEDLPQLPKVRIDYYTAKYLRIPLENARTRVRDGLIKKDKSGERLEASRLPTESTNATDAFKYLVMRPEWREIARSAGNKPSTFVG